MPNPKASQNGNPYIGIDIGGTSTRIGSFQSLDTSDFVLVTKFPTEQDYQQQLQQIIALNNSFIQILLQQKVNDMIKGATLELHLAAPCPGDR